ncbi:hypothetical protein [Streptomyces sp. NPDC059994]|uniref:hypothetical protein n=1 Tax=Streptomyces sp. NPDC059994 TaxID=3347029 RepID=UPI003680C3CD
MAFALILVIGIVLANVTGGSRSPGSAAPSGGSPSAAASPGGSGGGVKAGGVASGVPVGYPRTREGVTAAAVNYEVARSSPSYVTNQSFRHSVLAVMMASDSLAGQQQVDDRDAIKLTSALGSGKDSSSRLILRAAALGTQVGSYSPEVATVRVWMSELVGMTSSDSPVPVSANWSTYALTLQWQHGDWKISDISQSAGPTPLQTSDRLPDSVGTFRKMDEDFHAPPYVG